MERSEAEGIEVIRWTDDAFSCLIDGGLSLSRKGVITLWLKEFKNSSTAGTCGSDSSGRVSAALEAVDGEVSDSVFRLDVPTSA